MNLSLHPDRIPGIIEDLKQGDLFHCHKTINYSLQFDDDDNFIPSPTNQLCAGSLLYVEKAGIDYLPLRLAHVLGAYDFNKMYGQELIIDVIEGDETDDKV
jgi:hypothetical protein